MKPLLKIFFSLLGSRALTSLVILSFLLFYIGIAFFSSEPLTTLISFTRDFIPLAVILALIPINCAVRLVRELNLNSKRRAALNGAGTKIFCEELFTETVHLSATNSFAALKDRLEAFGYRSRLTGSVLAAWKGISLTPVRMLFLAATFCLFSGILHSTTLRVSQKVAVVEGEPFPLSADGRDQVQKIVFESNPGIFLERSLSIQVAGADGNSRQFGLYPPAFYQGVFVYPRYLSIAPLIRFSAPDLPSSFETHLILMIYPPGKEDSAEIPESNYRIVFSMAEPQDGDDPFQSGRINLLFRVLQGDKTVAAGNVPLGGEFNANGYRLSFPEFRRVVATDLVSDYGVMLIWAGMLIFCLAILVWLPLRLFFPRREMVFVAEAGFVHASSRAEGRRGKHGGMFHEALDFLASDRSAGSLHVDEAQRSTPNR